MLFGQRGESIGRGAEREIFVDKNNPDRVIGLYHEHREDRPEIVKARLYFGKLMNILFPEHIPDVHYAKGHGRRILTADRIKFSSFYKDYLNFFESKEELDIKRVKELNTLVEDRVVQSGIEDKFAEAGVYVDNALSNFVIDNKDNVVYVDTFEPWDFDDESERYRPGNLFDESKMRKAIERIEDPLKHRQAIDFFNRILELKRQEKISRGLV